MLRSVAGCKGAPVLPQGELRASPTALLLYMDDVHMWTYLSAQQQRAGAAAWGAVEARGPCHWQDALFRCMQRVGVVVQVHCNAPARMGLWWLRGSGLLHVGVVVAADRELLYVLVFSHLGALLSTSVSTSPVASGGCGAATGTAVQLLGLAMGHAR